MATYNEVNQCDLAITWDDGLKETITFQDIPEYIRDEIKAYLQELEELRNEDKQLYDDQYCTIQD